MPSGLSYLEIGSDTGTRSAKFFEQLFGWTFHRMGDGAEGWFDTPTGKAGMHTGDPQPGFSVYFEVPDIEKAAALVKQLGGTADPIGPEEPGFGRFCSCKDPEGVKFGLHQPAAAG